MSARRRDQKAPAISVHTDEEAVQRWRKRSGEGEPGETRGRGLLPPPAAAHDARTDGHTETLARSQAHTASRCRSSRSSWAAAIGLRIASRRSSRRSCTLGSFRVCVCVWQLLRHDTLSCHQALQRV